MLTTSTKTAQLFQSLSIHYVPKLSTSRSRVNTAANPSRRRACDRCFVSRLSYQSPRPTRIHPPLIGPRPLPAPDCGPFRYHPLCSEGCAVITFTVGQIYYGTLSCAHGDFPVRCIKRTTKSVWFEHASHPDAYRAMRCKARPWSDNETANFHGWYISATKLSGGDFDLNTI